QALEAAGKFYSPREWDCTQAFAVVLRHDYQQPMAIAQVLPALVDKPYLEAGSLDRATRSDSITVHYTVINTLRGQPFSIPITVTVPHGSTLLKVLEVAEKEDPENFRGAGWGGGHGGDTVAQPHACPSAAGVGSYRPHNGEHIEAVFSPY
ncbi:Gastric intrinsic factor, partial [Buceros rhinoceros silvestris]